MHAQIQFWFEVAKQTTESYKAVFLHNQLLLGSRVWYEDKIDKECLPVLFHYTLRYFPSGFEVLAGVCTLTLLTFSGPIRGRFCRHHIFKSSFFHGLIDLGNCNPLFHVHIKTYRRTFLVH